MVKLTMSKIPQKHYIKKSPIRNSMSIEISDDERYNLHEDPLENIKTQMRERVEAQRYLHRSKKCITCFKCCFKKIDDQYKQLELGNANILKELCEIKEVINIKIMKIEEGMIPEFKNQIDELYRQNELITKQIKKLSESDTEWTNVEM